MVKCRLSVLYWITAIAGFIFIYEVARVHKVSITDPTFIKGACMEIDRLTPVILEREGGC